MDKFILIIIWCKVLKDFFKHMQRTYLQLASGNFKHSWCTHASSGHGICMHAFVVRSLTARSTGNVSPAIIRINKLNHKNHLFGGSNQIPIAQVMERPLRDREVSEYGIAKAFEMVLAAHFWRSHEWVIQGK